MSKILVVVFDHEQAYAGALCELHSKGSVSLYAAGTEAGRSPGRDQ